MNLTALSILETISQSDSLQQAALKLHKTQPALSMALRKLEQQCGFALVDRSAYRLKLTPAGERYFQQARQVLHHSAQLKSLARHLSQGAEASLRISIDESVLAEPYLTAIQQAQQQFPHTELSISFDYRLLALEKLKQQQTDLAISPWFPVFISLGEFLPQRVGEFELIPVASAELLQQFAEPLSHTEHLHALPQLVADSQALDFDSSKLLPLQSAHRVKVNNSNALKHALRASLGWSMVARHQIKAELDSGELVQLRLQDFPLQLRGNVHLVRHRDQLLGPVAEFLWQQWTSMAQVGDESSIN